MDQQKEKEPASGFDFTGSFNRAQPTEQGGPIYPKWTGNFRRYSPDSSTPEVISPQVLAGLRGVNDADIPPPRTKGPDWNGWQLDRIREYSPPKTIDDPAIRAMAGEYMYHRIKMQHERSRLTVNPSWVRVTKLILEKGPMRFDDLDIKDKVVVPYLYQFDLVAFIYTKEDQSGRLLACTSYGLSVCKAYENT
jgi:hypothetical protein